MATAGSGDREGSSIYDQDMSSLPPGLASARRPIAIVGLALVGLAIVGALAYSFQDVGNGCGSGWAAARKPLPSPLLTPAEVEAIRRDKRNPYEAGVEKARPIRECRTAGAKRLTSAGIGAGLVLLPVGAVLGYLYWPRREELVEEYYVEEPRVERVQRFEPPPAWGGRSSFGTTQTLEADQVDTDEVEDEVEEEDDVEVEDAYQPPPPPAAGPSDDSGWGEWRKPRP